jgi:hypothetical protein
MSPHSAPPSDVGSQRSGSRPVKKPSDWDPSSPKITGAPNLYTPSPKNGSLNQGLDELAGSPVSYSGVNGEKQVKDEDLDSNVQQGMRSELGETIPIHTTGMVSSQLSCCATGILTTLSMNLDPTMPQGPITSLMARHLAIWAHFLEIAISLGLHGR